MTILSVGKAIRHKSVDNQAFRSPTSFLDYDIVLWDPSTLFHEYRADTFHPEYMGCRSLDDADSAHIKEDIARRSGELTEMLGLGRSVVLFLPPPQRCYYATGKETYSGTGRSRVTTRMVSALDIPGVIPIDDLSTTAAEGEKIEFRGDEPFRSYWSKAAEAHYYSAYLSKPVGMPFLFVTGTTKVVATWIPKQSGILLLLPQAYDEEMYDTKKAYVEASSTFIAALLELLHSLRKETGDTQIPGWASRIMLPGQDRQLQLIRQKEGDLNRRIAELDDLKRQLSAGDRYKLLLYGSGRALEAKVAEILREIGFTVEEPGGVRDDLILRHKDKVAVAEIKGVTKSAAEKHAAQLEKWVSEHFAQTGIKPKGFLIVNPHHATPLGRRTDPAFPDQMISYSKNRDHCLVTTVQLLCIVLHLRENPGEAESIIERLLATSGVFLEFSDFSKWLSEQPAPENISEQQAGAES